MEMLIVESASRSKMEALKAFLAALKMEFMTAPAKHRNARRKPAAGVVNNPETLHRIADIESGKANLIEMNLEEIRQRYGA